MNTIENAVLYASPTSPFVRRVKIALKRAGVLFEAINIENLFPPPDWFLEINPLGLIPALKVGNETLLLDSQQILEFLDDNAGGVWHREQGRRWKEKRVSTLATGIMLQGVQWKIESAQNEPRRAALDELQQRIEAALPFLGRQYQALNRANKPGLWNQAECDVAIVLDYLSFRLPQIKTREETQCEDLWAVCDELRELEDFEETDPRQ